MTRTIVIWPFHELGEKSIAVHTVENAIDILVRTIVAHVRANLSHSHSTRREMNSSV